MQDTVLGNKKTLTLEGKEENKMHTFTVSSLSFIFYSLSPLISPSISS
jgi:hypothetical protein